VAQNKKIAVLIFFAGYCTQKTGNRRKNDVTSNNKTIKQYLKTQTKFFE
jgi:hypothetical protein